MTGAEDAGNTVREALFHFVPSGRRDREAEAHAALDTILARVTELEEALGAVWDYEQWDDWEEITGPKKLNRAWRLVRAALGRDGRADQPEDGA